MVERGFTLIELCIALVVMAILTAIAWGQYQDHMIRTRQAEVRVQLLSLLHQLERENDATLVTVFHTAHYQFYASRIEAGSAGLAFWLVQAMPQGAMAGTGGFGVDSRGYSCFAPMQSAPCVPQTRGGWN